MGGSGDGGSGGRMWYGSVVFGNGFGVMCTDKYHTITKIYWLGLGVTSSLL